MSILVNLAKDYYLKEMDRLVDCGRMPKENIPAAEDRILEMLEWLQEQPSEYFKTDGTLDGQNAFFEKVARDFVISK